MSNLHKLFKELRQLSEDERDILQELVREADNVERTCKNLGITYTDEMLNNWLTATAHYSIKNLKVAGTSPSVTQSASSDPTLEKMKQIVKGDNLDMIEEAAKDKGLI